MNPLAPSGRSALALAAALALASAAQAHGPQKAATLDPASLYDELEQEKANDNIWKAFFPDLATARKAAISFHNNLLESHYEAGYLVIELGADEMDRLRRFGFRFERAAEFIERRNQRLTVLQIEATRRALGAPEPQSIPGYACYETVEETFAAGDGLIAAKPTLARWADAGDSWLKTQGAGGYDIRVLKLANAATDAPGLVKPKLFVNSAIHAREYTTAPLMLEFARWLVNGHGTNADATWILDHHEVHLMLHTNPDGRKRAEGGLSWRKNVNNNFCANTNTRGIDLNRNFSFAWNSTAGVGSSGSACNLTFRGLSAGSEPEVQAIQAYVRSLWPDRRGPGRQDAAPADTSGIHLDIHSYSELVLWPWGDEETAAPNGAALQTLGRRFAFFNNYTPMQSVGLYPTDGTSDNISYGELGVAAFTFELGTSFFQSCTTYNNTIKPQNLNALIYAAKVVRTPYITPGGPEVTGLTLSGNAATTGVTPGTPVTLSGSATDTRFNNSSGAEPVQAIAAAQYTIDTPPWDPQARTRVIQASDGSFNTTTEALSAALKTSGLAPGLHTVYVRARDAGGTWGPVTASFLRINPVVPTAGNEVEPNNTPATAQVTAALPVVMSGSADSGGDSDHYRIAVPAGATVIVTLSSVAGSDANLALLDAQGNVLASSSRGMGQTDSVKLRSSSPLGANWIVRVQHAAGGTGAAGGYTLTIGY
jgi:carboxypeptidase T